MSTKSPVLSLSYGFLFLTVLGVGPRLEASLYILPERSQGMTAEGIALGGALVAYPSRSDFSQLNPASPAFEKKYTIGLGYASGGDLLRAQITDTKSSDLGGALSFNRKELEGLENTSDLAQGNFSRTEMSIPVSLMGKASDSVALGVSGRYRNWTSSQTGTSSQNWWSLDVGLLLKLSPEWSVGVVAQDLLEDSLGYSHRSFSLGFAGLVAPAVTVLGQIDFLREPTGSLDTGFVLDEPKPTLRAAVEYTLPSGMALRGSYASLPSWEQKYVGAGFLFKKDTFLIEYGFRMSTEETSVQYHALSFGVDL